MACFTKTDILLPKNCDFTKWSVVACDQYTSDRSYWKRIADYTAGNPSALNLILPEAYLEGMTPEENAEYNAAIGASMAEYLGGEVFETLAGSLVYVERTLKNGKIRRGIVGGVDLEMYDFRPGTKTEIRASEATVADRLPPRAAIRSAALIEIPHVLVLYDDIKNDAVTAARGECGSARRLYDFTPYPGNGRLCGWQIYGEAADRVVDIINAGSIGGASDKIVLAVGDGNHSLAAAKLHWEKLRAAGAPSDHPARFALAELVNIYDETMEFEPIYRAVFGADPDKLLALATRLLTGSGTPVEVIAGGKRKTLRAPEGTLAVSAAQSVADAYVAAYGGTVDYIHGRKEAEAIGNSANNAVMLFGTIERNELFPYILTKGVLPKKAFSIGEADDKRYYLEARKIVV